MNKKLFILIISAFLMLGSSNSFAQTVLGKCSDTLYLLSAFHNSGDENNISENYYCALFLDKKSVIEKLLPLLPEKRKGVPIYSHGVLVEEYMFVDTESTLERQISEEIDNYFVANAAIGVGIAVHMATWEYLKDKDTTDPYYYFMEDTLRKSEFRDYPFFSDILEGEIINSLNTGGLMIRYDSSEVNSDLPIEPWNFEYTRMGTYYRLFKISADYLLLEDPQGNVLTRSYSWTINSKPLMPDNLQSLKFFIGDVGGSTTFSSHLKTVLKDGKLLTALPYRVKKIAEP